MVLKNMKSGTAASYDNILLEFLKHSGPRAKNWLTSKYGLYQFVASPTREHHILDLVFSSDHSSISELQIVDRLALAIIPWFYLI